MYFSGQKGYTGVAGEVVMKNKKVRDIMSTNLETLEEDENLEIVEYVMEKGSIRHLPVVKDKRLVGLVTHRDLMRAQVSSLAEMTPEEAADFRFSVTVRDIMATRVTTISPDATVLEAAKILQESKFGCLPVVQDGELVGIVTEADFIGIVIRALEG
jgi:CBS domain-containing protein